MITLLAVVTMMNVAHRGLWVEAKIPQNTVEAIKAAYDAGAITVETDFIETKSGELICLHDKRSLLSMVKAFEKDVVEITPEDRATINLGEKAKTDRPYRIPTVDEVMKVVPKDGILQSEIKIYGPNYADKFDAAVKNAGLNKKNITVSSFNLEALKDFHAKYPTYTTIWLVSKRIKPGYDVDDLIARCRDAGVSVMCPSCANCMKVEFKAEDAEKVRKSGLDFRVYGVKGIEALKYAAKLKASGFTCDTFLAAYEWASEIPDIQLAPKRR